MVGRGFEGATLAGSPSSERGVELRRSAARRSRFKGAVRTYLRFTLGSPSGVWICVGVVFFGGDSVGAGGEEAWSLKDSRRSLAGRTLFGVNSAIVVARWSDGRALFFTGGRMVTTVSVKLNLKADRRQMPVEIAKACKDQQPSLLAHRASQFIKVNSIVLPEEYVFVRGEYSQ